MCCCFGDSHTLFARNTVICIFDKNANSIYDDVVSTLPSHKVSLSTVGVCVFYASASVGAFFLQMSAKKGGTVFAPQIKNADNSVKGM